MTEMAMTDIAFMFIFLPISLLTILVQPRWKKYVLLFLSLFYYACGSPRYFVLFLGMLAANVALTHAIRWVSVKKGEKNSGAKFLLVIGILFNLAPLFYYKYYDFAIENINQIFHTTFGAKNLLLPMGISFFVFKSISLLVDVYKGAAKLENNPVFSALYLSFFGQIVSGPICRYNDFYQDWRAGSMAKAVWSDFSKGGYLFVRGAVKKVLIANVLSPVVNEIFHMDMTQTSAPLLWIGAICYSLQLYYDFSGYSDMAIGIGNMYGIHCPENFNYPYATKSVSEFWRRWHISLGAWFRDYIYIPLGGSRVDTKFRLFFNLFVVWIATGIWHGANWTFIYWGLVYFVAIALEKALNLPGRLKTRPGKILYRIAVLAFINFQWVIFNSANLHAGLQYIRGMILGYGNELANIRTMALLKEYGILIAAALLFSAPIVPRIKQYLQSKGAKVSIVGNSIMALILGVLFICALSFVIAGQNNPFLYGNF